MTGKQLSQNKIDTTSRDANLTRDSINASSTRIADTTGTDLLGKRRHRCRPHRWISDSIGLGNSVTAVRESNSQQIEGKGP